MSSTPSPSPTTAPPAASPNSTQVLRSVQSAKRDSASALSTSSLWARPEAIRPSATASAAMKPVQPPLMSMPMHFRPRAGWMSQARAGLMVSAWTVLTSTKSISSGATPAFSRAALPARSARDCSVSSDSTLRSRMPVRVDIHSSLVSRNPARSSLVTTFFGSALPVPSIFKRITPSYFNSSIFWVKKPFRPFSDRSSTATSSSSMLRRTALIILRWANR